MSLSSAFESAAVVYMVVMLTDYLSERCGFDASGGGSIFSIEPKTVEASVLCVIGSKIPGD